MPRDNHPVSVLYDWARANNRHIAFIDKRDPTASDENFVVEVRMDRSGDSFTGRGRNKKTAKRDAASHALRGWAGHAFQKACVEQPVVIFETVTPPISAPNPQPIVLA